MGIIDISKLNIDPRVTGRTTYKMEHIIYITIAAVIAGSQSWSEIAAFGEAKREFFKSRLPGLKAIPSHDTFNRFFSIFDPRKFEMIFREWVRCVTEDIKGVIAIDGKLMRGPSKCDAAHPLGKEGFRTWIVTAWASDYGISLGQEKVDDKSNEITAIPKVLSAIDLKGTTVTIDAMGCQTDITEDIIEGKGNYVIALKENQKNSYKLAKQLIEDNKDREYKNIVTRFHSSERSHGRLEERTCVVVSYGNTTYNMFKEKFAGLKSVVGMFSRRTIISTGETSEYVRYYITSLGNDSPEEIANAIRKHWSVENNLHWQLDFTFREDQSRKVKNAAQNFSTITKIALSILKRDNSTKGSINLKRKKAGWDNKYLEKLLDDNAF